MLDTDIRELTARLCGPFVFGYQADAEDAVHFAYQTARDFLLSTDIHKQGLGEFFHNVTVDHAIMLKAIIDFILSLKTSQGSNFTIETQSLKISRFIRYSTVFWPQHARESHSILPKFFNDEAFHWLYSLQQAVDQTHVNEAPYYLGGGSIVHALAFHGLDSTLNLLMVSYAATKLVDSQIKTPRKFFLEKLHGMDQQGSTPLFLAARHPATLKLLLEMGSSLTTRCSHGLTPFHVAVATGNIESLEVMLMFNPDLEVQDENGETPIFHALRSGNEDAAFLLTAKGANVMHTTLQGWTTLHESSLRGSIRFLKENISKFDNINIATVDGFTPLHCSANEAVAAFLLDFGADIDHPNQDGLRPIHEVSRFASVDAVKYLSTRVSDLTIVSRTGWNVMHLVAAESRFSVFRYFLELQRFDLEATTSGGDTCLSIVAEAGSLDCVGLLCEAGAEINPNLDDRIPPLNMAARGGHLKICEYLVEKGALADAIHNGNTAFELAYNNGHVETARFLLEKGASTEGAKSPANLYHISPLNMAVYSGNVEMVQFLLENRANVESLATPSQFTPLYLAARRDQIECFSLLLAFDANVDTSDIGGATPLHYAARNGNIYIVHQLLRKGARSESRDNQGWTLFLEASFTGQSKAVQILLLYYLNASQTLATLSVAEAASSDYKNLVLNDPRSLEAHESQIASYLAVSSKNGFTAIHEAASENRIDTLLLLLGLGADPNARSFFGTTPLHCAAYNGHTEAIGILISEGATIDALRKQGVSPVMESVAQSHEKAMNHLLTSGCNPHIRDSLGQSLLHVVPASKTDMLRMIYSLGGFDIELRDAEGLTLLLASATRGDRSLIIEILRLGGNAHARSNGGFTALHHAAKYGYSEVVSYLLETCSCDPNMVDLDGCTPLHLATEFGQVQTCIILLGAGANFNASSPIAGLPLHSAIRYHWKELAKVLLDSGANPTLRDNFGYTSYDLVTTSPDLADLIKSSNSAAVLSDAMYLHISLLEYARSCITELLR